MLNNNHLFSFTIPMVLFPLMPITTSLKLNFNNNDKYKTPQGLTPQGIISFIKLLIYLVKKCVENKLLKMNVFDWFTLFYSLYLHHSNKLFILFFPFGVL